VLPEGAIVNVVNVALLTVRFAAPVNAGRVVSGTVAVTVPDCEDTTEAAATANPPLIEVRPELVVVHVLTKFDTSRVRPSLNKPITEYCNCVPWAICPVPGVTETETMLSSVTLKFVVPGVPLKLAVITVLPVAVFDIANPLFFVMLATAGVPDVHVQTFEMSCVLPSENVPVAVNCCWLPKSMVGLAGLRATELIDALVTVKVAVPLTLPCFAVIVTWPAATPCARPNVPAVLLIVAFVPSDELHVTLDVNTWVELSLNVPVATNCVVVPGAIVPRLVLTAIDCNVTAGGGGLLLPPPPLFPLPPQPTNVPKLSNRTMNHTRLTDYLQQNFEFDPSRRRNGLPFGRVDAVNAA
jgi:hypothetical protein